MLGANMKSEFEYFQKSPSLAHIHTAPSSRPNLPKRFDQIPHGPRSGFERAAIKQHDRCSDGEPRRQPVPHHPAGGGIVKEDVCGCEVAVDNVLLFELQQQATGAVNNTFGLACRAGGEENKGRMVKRKLGESQRCCSGRGGNEGGPGLPRGNLACTEGL